MASGVESLMGGGLRGASCSIKVLSGEVRGLVGEGGRRSRTGTDTGGRRGKVCFVLSSSSLLPIISMQFKSLS